MTFIVITLLSNPSQIMRFKKKNILKSHTEQSVSSGPLRLKIYYILRNCIMQWKTYFIASVIRARAANF